jgi:hypothetical protein
VSQNITSKGKSAPIAQRAGGRVIGFYFALKFTD